MAAWSHRPWYKVSTPEQKRALEAENWRRQVTAQLFRAAHTQGEEDASEIIRRTGKEWGRNPLGPKDDGDILDPLAPPEVQIAADREQAVTRGLQPAPVKQPGVPRGVAEAQPSAVRPGDRVYDSGTASGGDIARGIGGLAAGLNEPLVSPEGLPGPARMLVEELTRPTNALMALRGPATAARGIPVVGKVAGALLEPGAGGFARRLITSAGANAGARIASEETAQRLPEDTNPAVGFAAQLVAGLAGGVAGGAAGGALAARAPEAAVRYKNVTQNIPVGASVKDVSGGLPGDIHGDVPPVHIVGKVSFGDSKELDGPIDTEAFADVSEGVLNSLSRDEEDALLNYVRTEGGVRNLRENDDMIARIAGKSEPVRDLLRSLSTNGRTVRAYRFESGIADTGGLESWALSPKAPRAFANIHSGGRDPITVADIDIDSVVAAGATDDLEILVRTAQRGDQGSVTKEPSIVERFTNVIQQAKPLRNQTARMQSIERGKRAGEFGSLRTAASGEAGARSARGALGGELPKLQFDAPRDVFEQSDIDQLFDINRQFKWGPKQRFDQATVDTALFKALSGQVPTQSEIKLLSKVYGADLANAILSKRGWGEKARENFYDVLNIPRTLASTVDFSGILRQGGFLVGHPTRLAKTVPAYVRATFSESFAKGVDDSIRTAPFATELEQAGLYIADRTRQTLGDREEAFMSRFLTNTGFKSRLVKAGVGGGVGYASGDTEEERRRNALIGAGAGFASPTVVKASERGYVTFLNKLRSDVAHDIMKNWDDQYREQNIERLARFVNAATGRGDLQELGNVGPALNAFFFSPRFLYSRFQLGAEAARSVATLNDPLSRTIAKDTVAFVGAGLAAMKLMQLSGQADVELDPRSSDFGKVKIGPTRYDFWGGYQQIARYTAQLITGERKTTTRGEITDANRLDTVGRFLQSKLSPTAGFAVDALRGESAMGDEITASKGSIKQQAWNRMAPLFIQDLTEAAQEEGLRGVIKTAPAGFGVGVQTFESSADIERRLAREMFPETPFEQLNREQLRAIKQSPDMQEKLGESGPLQERAKAKYAEQEYDDAELQAGRMQPDEWKDRRTIRNAEYGGMLLAEAGDKPIQNPRNAYEEYLNVLRSSRDQGGRIDFDQVEAWMDQQSPERQAQIEARSGLSDTPYVAERRAVSDQLRKTGFFDIRDETWAEMKGRMRGKVKAEAEQFASYDEYQQELVQQLTERLSRRLPPDIAYQRALQMISSHPAIGAFTKLQQQKRALWARSNNDLAQQAIAFGFLSASELNIGASGAIRPSTSAVR